MNERRRTRKQMLGCGFVTLLVVLFFASALLLLREEEKQQSVFPSRPTEDTSVEYDGEKYVPKDRVETFLVLGLDKYESSSTTDSYNNDKQSDFVMLLVFDNDAQTCGAIQINRDTMVNVNILGVGGSRVDTVTKQIALAHTYGNGREISCRNVANSVSDLLLDIKIDHYLSMTLDGVSVLNDLVGGVEVTVLDDFTGIDDTLVKGATVKLMGEHALHYVQARKGLEDSTNANRMKRQQQYINALYDQLINHVEADEEFLVEATLKISDYIVCNQSVTQLREYVRKFDEYEFTGIRNIEGVSKQGEQFIEFYPSEESIEQLVMELFYEREA